MNMTGKQTCAICGKSIEVHPINDEKGIFTYVKDTDETKTKREVFNLCSLHALFVKSYIFEESRKIKRDELV